MSLLRVSILIFATLFTFTLNAQEEVRKNDPKKPIPKRKDGHHLLTWGDMMGLNPKSKVMKKRLKDVMNKRVSIRGYMIPLDYRKKKVKEFLLVPFVPYCEHDDPPPVNMIINVKMSGRQQVEAKYWAIEVLGKMSYLKKAKKNGLGFVGNGFFELEGTKVLDIKR